MDHDPTSSRNSIFDRPIVRLGLAVVLLAILGGVALAVTAGRGGSSGSSATGRPAVTPESTAGTGALADGPPIVGKPAPDFALRDRNGALVRLSDLRGKVVWVNFWATWCLPCKKELPDVQAMYDEKRAEGLEVLEVNYQEGSADATSYFDERSLTLPLLLDHSGSVYGEYKLQGLPDSFFVDRDGNVAALQFGYLTMDKMRERLTAAGLP